MSVVGSFVGVRVRSDLAENSQTCQIKIGVSLDGIMVYVRVNSSDSNLYSGKQ